MEEMIEDRSTDQAVFWVPPRHDWPKLRKLLAVCNDGEDVCSSMREYIKKMQALKSNFGRDEYRIDRTTVDKIINRLDKRRLTVTACNIKDVLENPIGPFRIPARLNFMGDMTVEDN